MTDHYQPTERIRKSRSMGRIWVIGIIAVVAICIIGATYFLRLGSTIDESIAAIHRLGIPTTYEELEALGPQTGEDAASIYAKDAFRKWTPAEVAAYHVIGPESRLPTAPKYTVKQREDAANVLRPTLNWLRQGAKMQRWTITPDRPWLDIDKVPSFNTASSRMSGKIKLLSLVATADYESGNRALAMNEYHDIISVSRQAGENPDTLQQIFSRNYEEFATRAIVGFVKMHPKDVNMLEDAHQLLESLPPLPDSRVGLYADFVMRADVHEAVKRYEAKPNADRGSVVERIRDQLDQRKVALDFVIWRQAFTKLQSSPHWGWQEVHQVFTDLDHQYSSSPLYSGLAKDEAGFADFWGRWIAERRLMKDSVRVLQSQVNNGSVPRTLPNFGDDSVDPFTDQPLHYRAAGKRFVIYSVGPDRQDNGGLKRMTDGAPYDIVYEF